MDIPNPVAISSQDNKCHKKVTFGVFSGVFSFFFQVKPTSGFPFLPQCNNYLNYPEYTSKKFKVTRNIVFFVAIYPANFPRKVKALKGVSLWRQL